MTGLVFACTLWSAVIADDDGITSGIRSAIFWVRGAAISGIFLGDSVEIQCTPEPPAEEGQDRLHLGAVIDSPDPGEGEAAWLAWEQGKRSRPASYGQLPGRRKSWSR